MDDRTNAEALRIAYERLLASGWKFTLDDIGSNAAKIIKASKEHFGDYAKPNSTYKDALDG